MKMPAADYEALKGFLATKAPLVPSHREAVKAEGKAKDVEMRVRWDLMWATTPHEWRGKALRDLNDSHIDTALRAAMKELNLTPA